MHHDPNRGTDGWNDVWIRFLDYHRHPRGGDARNRSVALRQRGFTLLELSVALAILLTTLIATWSVIGGARRNERAMWDELLAAELAASALEQASAAEQL